MERRVAHSRGMEETLRYLYDEMGVFPTKQKALMFASVLGYQKNTRTPLPQKSSNTIYPSVFMKAGDDHFVDAIAVAFSKDLGVLDPEKEEERIAIFEELAQTGLEELEKIIKRPGDLLDNLIQMTEEGRHSESEDLSGLDPGVLNGLI